jgi:hypothetical protein
MLRKPGNADLEPTTLALHFLQPTRDSLIEEPEVVATCLVERVLRILLPMLSQTGPVIVRCAPILHEWGSDDCAMEWWESICRVPSFENGSLLLFGVDPRPNLRRAFVVTITGRLKGLMSAFGEKLKHHRHDRLLFIAEIDPKIRLQEFLYLSPAMTQIGELHPDGRFEASFDLIEYAPEMIDMLARLVAEFDFSSAASRQLQRLIAPSE